MKYQVRVIRQNFFGNRLMYFISYGNLSSSYWKDLKLLIPSFINHVDREIMPWREYELESESIVIFETEQLEELRKALDACEELQI